MFHFSGSSFDKCPFLVDSGLKIQKPGEEILKDIVVEKGNQGTYQVSDNNPTSEGLASNLALLCSMKISFVNTFLGLF